MLTVPRHGKAERAPTSNVHGGRENGTAQETIPKGITNQMGLRVRKKRKAQNGKRTGGKATPRHARGMTSNK